MLLFIGCGNDIKVPNNERITKEPIEKIITKEPIEKIINIIDPIKDTKIQKITVNDGNDILLIDTSKYIYFNPNKYNVSNKKKMKELLSRMLDIKNVYIELVGHTDSNGPDKYNQLLSELRAREVYKGFLELGLKKTQLNYQGYGEEQPLVSNKTAEGRKINRRVEFFISDNNDTIKIFLNTRQINTNFLNNHNNINVGKVEKTIKGLTKVKNDYEIKQIQKKLLTPKRNSFVINIAKRKHFIKLK
jgi:outer membrane protein OmpA-like peptidoglycan-associated protein